MASFNLKDSCRIIVTATTLLLIDAIIFGCRVAVKRHYLKLLYLAHRVAMACDRRTMRL